MKGSKFTLDRSQNDSAVKNVLMLRYQQRCVNPIANPIVKVRTNQIESHYSMYIRTRYSNMTEGHVMQFQAHDSLNMSNIYFQPFTSFLHNYQTIYSGRFGREFTQIQIQIQFRLRVKISTIVNEDCSFELQYSIRGNFAYFKLKRTGLHGHKVGN